MGILLNLQLENSLDFPSSTILEFWRKLYLFIREKNRTNAIVRFQSTHLSKMRHTINNSYEGNINISIHAP